MLVTVAVLPAVVSDLGGVRMFGAALSSSQVATVIVLPFDAPWVRMAVLADPAGASFIASKFVPENRDLARQTDVGASAA